MSDAPTSNEATEQKTPMSGTERRAAIALASIFSVRMLGLFMIMPVFTLYAHQYEGYSPAHAGWVIGIYGFTQALFQIPFGMLSDRFGRKRIITIGLFIFLAGSLVAASADHILGVIAGRALQGLGAIAAALLALTSDLTREENRTKAMAIIGASIGFAFSAALLAGPILTPHIGISGLFWLTAALAAVGIGVLHWYIPAPTISRARRDSATVPAQVGRVLRDSSLLRLDFGIFVLHAIMTASFVAIPVVLRDSYSLSADSHWMVYLIVLPLSLLLMVPAVMFADRKNRLRQVFIVAIFVLVAAQLGMGVEPHSLTGFVLLLCAYFVAFNTLEASLPSLVSRLAPVDSKGTALGVYSTAQYLGAGVGGTIGGTLYAYGVNEVFYACAGFAAAWLLVSLGMTSPPPVTTRLVRVGTLSESSAAQYAAQLQLVRGVEEAVVIAEEGVAYLKVDRVKLDQQGLNDVFERLRSTEQ